MTHSNVAKELLIGLRKPWDCVFVGFVFILTTKNRVKIRTAFSVLVICTYYVVLKTIL